MNKKKLTISILIIVLFFVAGCEPLKNLNKDKYRLFTEVKPEKTGIIMISGTNNRPPKDEYYEDDEIKLEAEGIPNYRFEKWYYKANNEAEYQTNPNEVLQITMNEDYIVRAKFREGPPYSVNIEAKPSYAGSVEVEAQSNEDEPYSEGTKINLKAKANSGYYFSHWQGDINQGKPNILSTTVNKPLDITAVFISQSEYDIGITFADEEVEEAVRDRIDKPYGYILPDDIRNIEKISLAGANLSTLVDFQKFQNLKSLNLEQTGISNIQELENVTSLETLNLSENNITNISALTELDNLENIDLSNNPDLKDIEPLKKLRIDDNIIKLNLAGNSIENINHLSELTTLEELNLNGNSITDISSLAKLTNLVKLDLSHNQISTIAGDDVRNLDRLDELDLSHNSLKSIEFINFFEDENLTTLDLSNNSIEKQANDSNPLIDLVDIESLKKINLKNNLLKVIPDLSQIEYLDYLDFSNNQVENISGLNGLKEIKDLRLNNNNLDDDNNDSVLAPLDPEKNGPVMDVVELVDNNLDGVESTEIKKRLEENGTRVIY